MPLLGYDLVNRKLVVNELEANQVREMFELYRQHRALLPVVREIARRGWKTKSWTTQKGRNIGGRLLGRSKLYSILRNPTYTGKVRYKQEAHQGEHAAIVSQELFDEAQSILDGNGSQRVHYKDIENPPLLRGLLRCKPCETAMVHAFAQVAVRGAIATTTATPPKCMDTTSARRRTRRRRNSNASCLSRSGDWRTTPN